MRTAAYHPADNVRRLRLAWLHVEGADSTPRTANIRPLWIRLGTGPGVNVLAVRGPVVRPENVQAHLTDARQFNNLAICGVGRISLTPRPRARLPISPR
jgi:hypothetical protein